MFAMPLLRVTSSAWTRPVIGLKTGIDRKTIHICSILNCDNKLHVINTDFIIMQSAHALYMWFSLATFPDTLRRRHFRRVYSYTNAGDGGACPAMSLGRGRAWQQAAPSSGRVSTRTASEPRGAQGAGFCSLPHGLFDALTWIQGTGGNRPPQPHLH